MPKFPFRQVDAFTDRPLAGNACAVVLDASVLSEDQMLAVAREMNLAETAFVITASELHFVVRYFTPAREIPLAGHPTIATAYALADLGLIPLQGKDVSVTFELRVGSIQVDLEVEGDALRHVHMLQTEPAFLRTYEPSAVLPVFGLTEADLLPNVPIQTVSTGTPQLMVPLRGLDSLRRARMDVDAYKALLSSADFFSPHLFCTCGATREGQTFARHFDAPPDLPEDPFTGSATGGMAAYLWCYGLIERPTFTAEQGHWMERPGEAHVEVIGPPDNISAVRVGGAGVIILRGELFL